MSLQYDLQSTFLRNAMLEEIDSQYGRYSSDDIWFQFNPTSLVMNISLFDSLVELVGIARFINECLHIISE